MPKLSIQKLIYSIQNGQFAKDETAILLTALTKSELKLLMYMTDAPSNEDLSKRLGVKIKTVENRKTRIGQKLNQTGKNSLLRLAIKYKNLLEEI
jgi:DNA-binding NarL/FixJ family response regulator